MNQLLFEENCAQWLAEFLDAITTHRDSLGNEFWNCIAPVLKHNIADIRTIEISLLRSQLLVPTKSLCLIETFNQYGFFGGLLTQKEINFPMFQSLWDEKTMLLQLEAKKYMGNIPYPIVEKKYLELLPQIETQLALTYQCTVPAKLLKKIQEYNISISFGTYRRFQYAIF